MKSTKRLVSFIPSLVLVLMAMIMGACSVEDNPETADDSAALVMEQQQRDPNFNTVEEQLAFLTKRMRRYHNIQAAYVQGWDDMVAAIQNMGYHWMNGPLVDPTFEMLRPEILVYAPDENGDMQFVAVEYVIPGLATDDPPEGFIGEEDQWLYLPNVGWTLHAWVGLENPNGVFAPMNPLVILP